MIDTNQIEQAGQVAGAIKQQVTANWPAICAGLVWLRVELKNINDWAFGFAEYAIAHGGIVRFLAKIIWVKGAK